MRAPDEPVPLLPEERGSAAGNAALIADDIRTLQHLGYPQELLRRMSGFSNYAISLSIICILAGGITSFHLGLCSVGGAAIGLGWPLVCAFSLIVAATMGHVASAFPTAGGLYHWASILGGRGWGWSTAWFNLAGLITVTAAINCGTYFFVLSSLAPALGYDRTTATPEAALLAQGVGVMLITFSQALFNHLGIRTTTILTDFSGYWILLVSLLLTVAALAFAPHLDLRRLIIFTNFSGPAGGDVWPQTDNLLWLFALGFLLPAYTITGFDASAHTSEETIGAARSVPRGIVRSVLVSGVAGWIMLAAIVLAAPNLSAAAARGDQAFFWTMESILPRALMLALYAAIAVAQYLCGLAAITSASRMAFAFARDHGLPFSSSLRRISPTRRTPAVAIWAVSTLAVLFTLYTPVYATITAVCTIFLYISYVLPTALGALAYGRTWTRTGPWSVGRWYRPLAVIAVLGCGLLIAIGMQPPYDQAAWIVGATILIMTAVWYGVERHRFPGPPPLSWSAMRGSEAPGIRNAPEAVPQKCAE